MYVIFVESCKYNVIYLTCQYQSRVPPKTCFSVKYKPPVSEGFLFPYRELVKSKTAVLRLEAFNHNASWEQGMRQ